MKTARLARPDDLAEGEFIDRLELILTELGVQRGQVFFVAAPDTSEAHTRSGDPDTSRKAAATIDDLNDNQRAVLRVFEEWGRPMSDEQLQHRYEMAARAELLPRQSDSGVRTRRSELRDDGFLVEAGKTHNAGGREVQLFGLPNS